LGLPETFVCHSGVNVDSSLLGHGVKWVTLNQQLSRRSLLSPSVGEPKLSIGKQLKAGQLLWRWR